MACLRPSLQGVPRDDDVILHALPVAAPYSVVAGYRYKVKLTPGSQKRGKAARQARASLSQNACNFYGRQGRGGRN